MFTLHEMLHQRRFEELRKPIYHVHFDENSTVISREAKAHLDDLVTVLGERPKPTVTIDSIRRKTGNRISVVHPLADLLRERGNAGGPDPLPLLSIRKLFGDLIDHGAFVATLKAWLTSLYADGAAAMLSKARRMLSF